MILLIDNYDSFTYNLYQMIAQYDNTVKVVRNDKIKLDKIAELKPQAIILSPGPGHPREAGICVELIQKLSGHIPILGVCLGHQAIVHAFGGQVVRAKEVMHGKASEVFHDGQGIFAHMPSPFLAGRYHSLVAENSTLPEVLRVDAYISATSSLRAQRSNLGYDAQIKTEPGLLRCARNDEAPTNNDIIMGVKHKEHLTFGVQFHPESILTPNGYDLISEFLRLSGVKHAH